MGKNKNKLRTIYTKMMAILRKACLGSNFTGSYKEKESINQWMI